MSIMSIASRQCTIHLHNKTTKFTMTAPKVYLISGTTLEPLPPALHPSESGSALFIKTPYSVHGSVAVFTYNLKEMDSMRLMGRAAVMFSNPYNFSLYSNWYGVGVFSTDINCDENLFKLMYYGQETTFVRGKASGPSLLFEGDNVTLSATMSDSYQPVLTLEVDD